MEQGRTIIASTGDEPEAMEAPMSSWASRAILDEGWPRSFSGKELRPVRLVSSARTRSALGETTR